MALPQPTDSSLAEGPVLHGGPTTPAPSTPSPGAGATPAPGRVWSTLLEVECPTCSAGVGQPCSPAPETRFKLHLPRVELVEESAWRALRLALYRLDEPTPCAGVDEFTDDDEELRQIAALYCEGCPIIDECRLAGVTAQLRYVWGGVDLGVPPLLRVGPRRRDR